jgi:hypothetical protein
MLANLLQNTEEGRPRQTSMRMGKPCASPGHSHSHAFFYRRQLLTQTKQWGSSVLVAKASVCQMTIFFGHSEIEGRKAVSAKKALQLSGKRKTEETLSESCFS